MQEGGREVMIIATSSLTFDSLECVFGFDFIYFLPGVLSIVGLAVRMNV